MSDYTFKGWMGLDKNAVGHLEEQEFEPKPWAETDVDIQITHSGICGVSLPLPHTFRHIAGPWGAIHALDNLYNSE